MPESPEQKEFDVFSVVVLGAMNPRIHHPAWYQTQDLISKDEMDAALGNVATIVSPPIAQFFAPGFRVLCQEDRWDVQTNKRELIDRIQSICLRVFDDILKHTPITSLGINFDFARKTGVENVASRLASIGSSLIPWLVQPGATGIEVIQRRRFAEHCISRRIVRPHGESSPIVMVQNNFHFTFEHEAGFFSMKPYIDRFYADAMKDSEEFVRTILSGISGS